MSVASHLGSLAREALLLSLAISLPVVALTALVGLLVAIFQAASQIHDTTLAHLPRLVVMCVALAVLGSWMGQQLLAFAQRAFLGS